ncbi:F-box only protein 40-like [Saccostrea echinata]|uniref:F-box only protein 40-like n=1 Tax=Saccostrea echinata TaxID=191078 RepID=UPI002A8063AC|nr:F-box only protein 40-like [Saccostrea echinata]
MSFFDLYEQSLENPSKNKHSKLTEEEKHAITCGLLHAHCIGCVARDCDITPDGQSSCSVIECPYLCGQKFHRCKLDEHENFCMSKKVPCINHIYGCPFLIPREQQARHIPACPASVVKCMIEWHRWPMHSSDLCVKAPLPLNNPHVQCGQLDVALALRDQRVLLKSMSDEKSKPTEKVEEKSGDVPWETNKYPPGLQKSLCHGIFSPPKEIDYSAKEPINDDRNNYAKEHASSQLGDQGVDYISSRMGLAGLRRLSEIEREKRKQLENLATISPPQEKKVELQSPVIQLKKESTENNGSDEDKLINLYNKKIQLHELLGVCLNMEGFPSGTKIFKFSCDQNFRRDEIAWHFKNVHNEIQSGLNGVMEQRCPLAYQGCSFTHRKLIPLVPKGKIVHSSLLESFGLVIDGGSDEENIESIEDIPTRGSIDSDKMRRLREATPEIVTSSKYDSVIKVIPRFRRVSGPEVSGKVYQEREVLHLTSLPAEILEHIINYLDGFSLNNLSLTCTTLRQLCAVLLQQKGMVRMVWEKQENGDSWHVTKNKWSFSNSMTPIRQWKLVGDGVMSEHLIACPFNQEKDKIIHTEKIRVMENVDLMETTVEEVQ